jgi:hypothetical protein
MPIDMDALRARISARKAGQPQGRPDDDTLDSDLETLMSALEEARADVRRLTEEDEDLRGSAEIWVRLYDASLLRANRAEAELKVLRRNLPPNVQQLYEAMDRVALLTEAVSIVVKECDVCARSIEDRAAPHDDRTSEACGRCRRALGVLQSAAGLARSNP